MTSKYLSLNEHAELLTKKTGIATRAEDIIDIAFIGDISLYFQPDKKEAPILIDKIETAGHYFSANHGNQYGYFYAGINRKKYSSKKYEYHHPEIKTKGDIIQIPDHELLVLRKQENQIATGINKKRLTALDDFISLLEKTTAAKSIPFDRNDMPLGKEIIHNELKKRNAKLFDMKLSAFKDPFWKKHVAPLNLYGVVNRPDEEFIKKVLG